MIRSELIRTISPFQRIFINVRSSSSSIDIRKLEKETASAVDVVDEEAQLREEEIQRKRNKSRLKDHDRKLLFEENPYPEQTFSNHGTLKYVRRLYGRYGEASGVDPAICWPVKRELEESLEYEQVAYPFTIPQMVEDAKRKRHEKNERIQVRQENIAKKMEKLEIWKQEMRNRIAEKEQRAIVDKEEKERLVEEVRMHFGYSVDPKEEKFQEFLEKKQKELKKAKKEAKKKAKEESMLTKMLSNKAEKKKIEKKKADKTEVE